MHRPAGVQVERTPKTIAAVLILLLLLMKMLFLPLLVVVVVIIKKKVKGCIGRQVSQVEREGIPL